MNLPDIDEVGNALGDHQELSKIFQNFCDIYQDSPVAEYQMGPPRPYKPYDPLAQAKSADNYTGEYIEAWNIATSSNEVPLSEKPDTNFLDADGRWLPPPSDMSKDYVKGKPGLIWDPCQPWGKLKGRRSYYLKD